MKTYADKDHKHRNQPIAHQATQRKSDNNTEGATQTKLQQMANNSPQVKQLRALQQMANDSPQTKAATQLQAIADDHSQQTTGKQVVQRAVIRASRTLPDRTFLKGIRTSANFDTNHLVDGAATEELARERRVARGSTLNTIVSQAALIREIGDNVVGTAANTTCNNLAGTEAKVANHALVHNAPSIVVSARAVDNRPNILEIHHLHDSMPQLDHEQFPLPTATR